MKVKIEEIFFKFNGTRYSWKPGDRKVPVRGKDLDATSLDDLLTLDKEFKRITNYAEEILNTNRLPVEAEGRPATAGVTNNVGAGLDSLGPDVSPPQENAA